MKNTFALLLIITQICINGISSDQGPILHWDFETIEKNRSVELVSGRADTLEGNYMIAEGIAGKGVRFDGFTTCLKHQGRRGENPGEAFTIEAWVALGSYPWNWCPLLTTESYEIKGYRLLLGPLGQVTLQGAIDEQWISCSSQQEVIPLRKWTHIAAVYRADEEMALYLDGKLISSCPVKGRIRYPQVPGIRIGMVASPGKPSDIHRTWGTIATYFGVDGENGDRRKFGRKYGNLLGGLVVAGKVEKKGGNVFIGSRIYQED